MANPDIEKALFFEELRRILPEVPESPCAGAVVGVVFTSAPAIVNAGFNFSRESTGAPIVSTTNVPALLRNEFIFAA